MKVTENLWKALLAVLILALAVNCGKKDDDEEVTGTSTTTSSTSTSEIFTSTASNSLSISIISLPNSISQDMSSSGLRLSNGGGGGMAGIYSGVRQYVGMCDMFGSMVKELMMGIVGEGLTDVPLGEEFTIPDRTGSDDPYRIKVEKPTGETYEWKISLYFTESGANPEMIMRFTLVDEAAKGRLLWSMTEDITADGENASTFSDAEISGINVTRYVDLTFDGTSSTKTLEVKLVQDISEITSYAESNWSNLSSAVQSALDIGQPAKVFVYASYADSVFTIKGTSYHSGWATESSLTGDDTMWGDDDRSMYMFKAKATEGTGAGAKMYLALPLATTSDVTNVWTEDNLGSIFTTKMLNDFNAMIAKKVDNVDDSDTDGSGGSNANIAEEKAIGAMLMAWILNNTALNSLLAVYYSTGSTAAYNDMHSWLTTNRGSANAYVLTQAELEAFVNNANPDSRSASFQAAYKSISYMINPAFFDESDGFLGTYDETNDKFYNYSNNTMSEGSKPSTFTTLNALDLSSIESYVPTDVVSATITIE